MSARVTVEAALATAKETYRGLLATYVDPDDEIAVANTPVPEAISETVQSARVTVEHLMNALEFGDWPVEV